MPTFFSFQQGSEESPRNAFANDSSPLLGRFRAVPRPPPPGLGLGGGGGGSRLGSRAQPGLRSLDLLSHGGRGSVHVGYGALLAAGGFDDDDGDQGGDDDEEADDADESSSSDVDGHVAGLTGGAAGRRNRARRVTGKLSRKMGRRLQRVLRRMRDTWVTPRQGAVRRVVSAWWSRWSALVLLPALLAVAWCAVPFPQYRLDDAPAPPDPDGSTAPGHGAARVQVNFWFFLFVYYGFYNLTALIWITKVFNLYSLNWWPQSLGFPVTVSAIAFLSLAAPIPIYLVPESRFLTVHNTAWISWTFVIMAMPVAIAFCILMTHERHLGLRHSLSETQRIFTSSWWTGEPENTIPRRATRHHRRLGIAHNADNDLDPNMLHVTGDYQAAPPSGMAVGMRRRWLPASFVRFVWFCLALFVGLLAYVIGEAYAELYLRTLPHNNLETIVYVYGWILTVYLLDGLTGWILGGNEGERVGSYPLSWIFKLYFMLTYQTYVRALYARLRSPSQFVLLQVLSSSGLIILTPLMMSVTFHRVLGVLGLTSQSYGAYQKMCVRNVFIRFLAENASMVAFLGSVLVLHFGANKDVYPYFAFDDAAESYNFGLTFYASSITWACELAAGLAVAGLVRWLFGVSVVVEGKLDLAVWPELLPTSVAVMLHVLQNMLFSIIRLQFH